MSLPANREASTSQIFTRRAPERGVSFDGTTRTLSAVIATGTPVQRRDFEGPYFEVLSVKPGAVRLGRLKSGAAPLLDSHRSGSSSDKLGSVTDARIENGELIADARLSARSDVEAVAADIAGGTPPNVSVGYRVFASTESIDANNVRTITHTDWEPYEMSFVAIPADHRTYVRNQGTEMDIEVEERPENQPEHRSQPSAKKPGMAVHEVVEAYRVAENNDVPQSFVRTMIEDGATLQETRTAILNERAARVPHISSRTRHGNESFDNPEFLGDAIGNAIYARMTGKAADGPAAEWRGRSLLDMGAALIEARGERPNWRRRDQLASQIMTRSAGNQSTTDFPNLLTAGGNRVLLDGYKAAECPIKLFAKVRDAADFRQLSALKLSEMPQLLKVAEGGEIKYGARAEAKESFRVYPFARIFSLTREAIVNDDLNAFSDVSAAFGRAAAETEAQELAALFLANAGKGVTMGDGKAVYHTAHGNLAATAGALAVDTLSAARLAMRQMTGLDGKTPISVTPAHLLVGPESETAADQLLAAITPAATANVNPFAGKLQVHVEPRLPGNAWRLFADPSVLPTISIAYLHGHAGPHMDSQAGWETLGMEFRCVLDFGCGITESRGTYLNTGATFP